MKRILLLFAALTLSAVLSAQIRPQMQPGMKYKQLKSVYSRWDYRKDASDPYAPFWLGLSSFMTPGLGQFIAKEPGRGIAFLAGSFVISGVSSYAADDLIDLAIKDDSGVISFIDERAAKKDLTILLASGLAELALCIWSSVDANRIAKVKNMYYRDLCGRYGMETRMYPSVQLARTPNGLQAAPGMTLALSF